MLNQRQTEIIFEMYENPDVCFTTDYFSQKHKVGLRTAQSDIKVIKEELDGTGFATIKARKSKGNYLQIENHDMFSDWVNNLYMQYAVGGSLSYPMQRITKIVFILLERFRDMPMYELEDELFISRATLLNDLKSVQSQLEPFRLQISKENNRLRIVGSEIDKRHCLAENTLYLAHLQGIGTDGNNYINMQRISYLKNVLIDTFMENQYYISDTDFNNAVLTLNIILHRVQKSFFIKQEEIFVAESIDKELTISEKIFDKIKNRFLCNIPAQEIRFFAIYLKGQEIFKNHAIISQDMDQFILDSFMKIKHSYGIDFTNNISLRIAVALHCIPLVIRVKYNMQIHNDTLAEVKRSFPLGYEIAQYFTFLMREKYIGDAKINEDEIALLAAHFYGTLLEIRRNIKKTKVLIISALKSSMTVLLRSVLMKWFSYEISELEFIHSNEMTEDLLEHYDIFLTTDKNDFYDNGLAMFINSFPTENDRKNIKLLLDGFSNLDDVIQIFRKDLFFSIENGSRKEILELLTKRAQEEYGLSGLHEAVIERENIGSTFFSRGIAIPHPIHAISPDTFIAACVSVEPVLWDEDGHSVQIIMMIHIGKNNPRSFQIWDYFSRIFEDKNLVREVVDEPNFENFTAKIRNLLSEKFAKAE